METLNETPTRLTLTHNDVRVLRETIDGRFSDTEADRASIKATYELLTKLYVATIHKHERAQRAFAEATR